MIDPIAGAALADTLGGITNAMAGQSLADAYNERMTDTYTDSSGVEIGVGNYTSSQPSITGDSSGTVVDSNESDPSVAFDDYETAGGVVDSTTGGFIYGSIVGTANYSLLDTDDEVKAVSPVAVPIESAYVAIAQALGVSMKVSEVDPILGNKFANAIVAAGGAYDATRGLVTAWWDGVNILFPKKAAEAVEQVIEEEGIGDDGYVVDYDDVPRNPMYFPDAVYNIGLFNPNFSYHYGSGAGVDDYMSVSGEGTVYAVCTDLTGAVYYCFSDAPFVVSRQRYPTTWNSQEKTHNGITYHVAGPSLNTTINNTSFTPPVTTYEGSSPLSYNWLWDIAYLVFNGTVTQEGYPEGTSKSQATSYTVSQLPIAGGVAHRITGGQGIDTIDVVPIRVDEDTLAGDTTESTVDPITANPDAEKELPAPPVPLPIPDTNVSNPDVPLVDSSVVNSTLINELVEELATTLDPQPVQSSGFIPFPWMPGSPVIDPDTGEQTGTQYPSIVPASGSGLIHVYNPTPGEFVGFGNWLWVTYADATIDKIWNNPFDGIIGAHELYATPQVDGRDNIRSGFLVCPVSSNLVRQRYTEIDCGTVIVPEFYGNYFDYSPYSQAYIYLPFIGINEVSIDDIVGHAVNIRYRIDAYNGSCIAMIYVAKSGYRNLCYQFAGNCAVEVPLAGGSQAAIKAGMMQAEAYSRAAIQSAQIQKTASIGSGIVSGAAGSSFAGPLAGIIGALAGGTSGYIQGSANAAAAKLQGQAMQEGARYANKSSVQHSGQFGASHGAMGLKNPFIMIRNPIQVKVVNYNNDYGFPAHKRVIIGGCTGYLRVREVNVISAHATNEEKRAIEEELKAGVYV